MEATIHTLKHFMLRKKALNPIGKNKNKNTTGSRNQTLYIVSYEF